MRLYTSVDGGTEPQDPRPCSDSDAVAASPAGCSGGARVLRLRLVQRRRRSTAASAACSGSPVARRCVSAVSTASWSISSRWPSSAAPLAPLPASTGARGVRELAPRKRVRRGGGSGGSGDSCSVPLQSCPGCSLPLGEVDDPRSKSPAATELSSPPLACQVVAPPASLRSASAPSLSLTRGAETRSWLLAHVPALSQACCRLSMAETQVEAAIPWGSSFPSAGGKVVASSAGEIGGVGAPCAPLVHPR
mmetsp:Transcript_4436/g.12988  ORF Transcript_4436/g.12988 Transcript_4436/m.12988 type:complete len:249 (-) Transcript_4436:1130-1876(-)